MQLAGLQHRKVYMANGLGAESFHTVSNRPSASVSMLTYSEIRVHGAGCRV